MESDGVDTQGQEETQVTWLIPPHLRTRQRRVVAREGRWYMDEALQAYVTNETFGLANHLVVLNENLHQIADSLHTNPNFGFGEVTTRFEMGEIPKPPFLDRESGLHRRICKVRDRSVVLVVASDPVYAMDINDWNRLLYRNRQLRHDLNYRERVRRKAPTIARVFYDIEVQVKEQHSVLYYNAQPVHINRENVPNGLGTSCLELFRIFLALLRAKDCYPERILFVGDVAQTLNLTGVHGVENTQTVGYIGGNNARFRPQDQRNHINGARNFFGLEALEPAAMALVQQDQDGEDRSGQDRHGERLNQQNVHAVFDIDRSVDHDVENVNLFEVRVVENVDLQHQDPGEDNSIAPSDASDHSDDDSEDTRTYRVFFRENPIGENFQLRVFFHTHVTNSDQGRQYFQGVLGSYTYFTDCLVDARACLVWNLDVLGLPPREFRGLTISRTANEMVHTPTSTPVLMVSGDRNNANSVQEANDQTFLLIVDTSPLEEIATLFIESRKRYRQRLRNVDISILLMGFNQEDIN